MSEEPDLTDGVDRPLDWANEPHMSSVDTIMWRGDTDLSSVGLRC